jgi:hypothetical protein
MHWSRKSNALRMKNLMMVVSIKMGSSELQPLMSCATAFKPLTVQSHDRLQRLTPAPAARSCDYKAPRCGNSRHGLWRIRRVTVAWLRGGAEFVSAALLGGLRASCFWLGRLIEP